jgi:hypothetical protein
MATPHPRKSTQRSAVIVLFIVLRRGTRGRVSAAAVRLRLWTRGRRLMWLLTGLFHRTRCGSLLMNLWRLPLGLTNALRLAETLRFGRPRGDVRRRRKSGVGLWCCMLHGRIRSVKRRVILLSGR